VGETLKEGLQNMPVVNKAAHTLDKMERRIVDMEKILFKSTSDTRSKYFEQVNERVEFLDN
jgi:hypothetical protein